MEDKNFEIINECPWCKSKEYNQWGSIKEGKKFHTVVCKECKLIYVKKRFNKEALQEHYTNYYSSEHTVDNQQNEKRNIMYDIEYKFVNKYLDNSKINKILDVGCSGGMFLDYFKNDKNETFGIELGEEASKIASKKHNVWYGSFDDLHIDVNFDLIIFRGVIEHIPNPKDYLEKSINLLNSGGIIYITSTPNSESVSCEVFEDKWNQHLPEEHIMHFSAKHFNLFFEEYGFDKLEEYYFYRETPYADVYNDIIKVAKAIQDKIDNKEIKDYSPAFFENLMSLIYKKK